MKIMYWIWKNLDYFFMISKHLKNSCVKFTKKLIILLMSLGHTQGKILTPLIINSFSWQQESGPSLYLLISFAIQCQAAFGSVALEFASGENKSYFLVAAFSSSTCGHQCLLFPRGAWANFSSQRNDTTDANYTLFHRDLASSLFNEAHTHASACLLCLRQTVTPPLMMFHRCSMIVFLSPHSETNRFGPKWEWCWINLSWLDIFV